MSRALPTVAFQGALGAFSHEAIKLHWRGAAAVIPCDEFAGAIGAVVTGRATHAMVPVDNNTIGRIHQAWEALNEEPRVCVTGHVIVPVRHCLMVRPGTRIGTLQRALSHPAALAQCTSFLARHALEAVDVVDTAGAATMVARGACATDAAIAPFGVAARYGLEILAEGIQDRADNATTFAIVERTAGLAVEGVG